MADPELAPVDPAERERELVELRELVAGLTFRFAKTMPQFPHWYVVRDPDNEAVYLRLFRAIRTYGQDQKFGPFRGRYLHLGDGWKYWAMTAWEGKSRIINRDQQLQPEAFAQAETPASSGPPAQARGPRRRPG
jgi:hypothetical protein